MKIFPLITLFLLTLCQAQDQDSLRNVFVLWRHGDRAPFNSYLNLSSVWVNGLTELTDAGIVQQFELGQFLRNEYDTFIPEHYHYSHYHLRSSDIDRALMSGQSNAAGFFAKNVSLLANVKWQPIPIHTVDKAHELLFNHHKCPKLAEMIASDYKNMDGIKFLKRYKATADIIEKELGLKFKGKEFGWFHDELVCLNAHKVPLPSWVDAKVQKDLHEIAEHFWALQFSGQDRLIFQAGVFMRKLMKHVNSLINNGTVSIYIDGEERKLAKNHMMAYSGHDTNVAAIMSTLRAPVPMPGYTASVIFELHGPEVPGNVDDFYFIIKYKNSFEDTQAKVVKVPVCKGTKCHVKTLFEHLQKFAIEDEDFWKKCDGQNPPIVPDSKTGIYVGIAAFIFCILAPALAAIFYTFYKRKRLHNGYTNIDTDSN